MNAADNLALLLGQLREESLAYALASAFMHSDEDGIESRLHAIIQEMIAITLSETGEGDATTNP